MKRNSFLPAAVYLCMTAALFGAAVLYPARAGADGPAEGEIGAALEQSYLLAAVRPAARKYVPAKKYVPPKKKPVKKQRLTDIRTDFISVGVGLLNYEKDLPHLDASESASYGMVTAKMQVKVSYMLLKFFAEYTELEADYVGRLSTGQTVDGTVKNTIGRGGCHLGFSYAFSQRFTLTAPYAGLEYRHWRKKGEFTGVTLDERYEWFALPLGIKLQYQLLKHLVVGIDLSAGPTLGGRCTVFSVRNDDPDSLDVPYEGYPIFKLKERYFYRGELPFELYLGSYVGFELCPWYEYTTLGSRRVKTINYGDVVESSMIETRAYGVGLSFKIYF